MPADMFQEVVCPGSAANRRWYTPVSFLAHTIAIGILIVVPLVAADVLPQPRALLQYMAPPMPATMVTEPPKLRASAPPRAIDPTALVPIVAPEGISPEKGLSIASEHVALFEGVIDGFVGADSSIIETAPPPVREQAPQPVRISRGIQAPAKIKDATPEYPDIARRNRVQGLVILEAVIGVDGRVQRARVLRSVPLLDQAALNAVHSWEYTPTLLDGRPVPVIMTVTVNFKLE